MGTNRSLYTGLCQLTLRLRTRLFGTLVGADPYGNYYYVSKRKDWAGRQARWVMYKGEPDPTTVPAAWFGWLHHTCDAPLPSTIASGYLWFRPHVPNLTGTGAAYLPAGHELSRLGQRLSGPMPADPSVWRPTE